MKKSEMRIIAGTHRGRPIQGPHDQKTRPLRDRVRQALFNILTGYIDWNEKVVCDAFAGTGALGFESLSRGAAQIYAFDVWRPAIDCITQNAQRLQFESSIIVTQKDTCLLENWFYRKIDLLFLAPPYFTDLAQKSFGRFHDIGALSPECIVVHECHKTDASLSHPALKLIKTKEYGITILHFYDYNGTVS